MTSIRKNLRLDEILIPDDRMRKLSEANAQSLAASIDQDGLLYPIDVYHSSRAALPYTLIAGLHRWYAHILLGRQTIEVTIRTAAEALRMEAAENLFRYDLNELDRAHFAQKYAESVGTKLGRPKKEEKSAMLGQLFGGHFVTPYEAERMGFIGRTGRRLRQIENDLSSELKDLFRNTEIAGNQAKLLKCAKLPPADQAKIAAGMSTGASLETCLKWLNPEGGRMDETERLFKRISSDLNRLSKADRDGFLRVRGYVKAPMPMLPAGVPPVAIAVGNSSPIFGAIADAKHHIERVVSKREYADAAMAADAESIRGMMQASAEREAFAAKRKPRRKAVRDPVVVKESNARWLGKTFIEPLAGVLDKLNEKPGTPLVKFCQTLKTDGEQFIVACELGNDHDLRDAEYRIDRYRENFEREWETIMAWKLQNSEHHKPFIEAIVRHTPRKKVLENMDNGNLMQQALADIKDMTGEEDIDSTPEEFQGYVARLHPLLAEKMLKTRSLGDMQLLKLVVQLNQAEQIYVAHDVPGVSWRGEAYRRAWELLEKKHMGKSIHAAGNA